MLRVIIDAMKAIEYYVEGGWRKGKKITMTPSQQLQLELKLVFGWLLYQHPDKKVVMKEGFNKQTVP